MSFKDQGWATRYSTMGDTAEAVFEQVWPSNWERWGLNRPRLNVAKLPARIRHSPDYITSSNFVEVKGCGGDQTIKLKLVEHNCMHFWNNLHPLLVFFYDSHRNQWTFVSLNYLDMLVENGDIPVRQFPEGKAYWAFDRDIFTGWTDVEVP